MARSRVAGKRPAHAAVFAALGDETRLALLTKLYAGQRHSITELTEGSKLTRQAITKHLRVLERARLIHGTRAGRENVFRFDPQPIEEMKAYLEAISSHWDKALSRLEAFVAPEG